MPKIVQFSAVNYTVSFSVGNPANKNQPILYTGTTSALEIILGNLTGGDIVLKPGCTLEIFMPSYFSDADVKAMAIKTDALKGWTFSRGEGMLILTWGTASGTWKLGENIEFSVTNIVPSSKPASDSIQVNFNDLKGSNIPAQVTAVVALNDAPVKGNASLLTALQPELQFNGLVYVSEASNPLINTLYLNVKNISSTPLYNGSEKWQGNPRIIVGFVYGSTSGALAPADKKDTKTVGSAWKISGGISVDQTGGWKVKNPLTTDQLNAPVWVLTPASTNKQLIGTGAAANVTFAFSNIFSLTPVGATQMYVQFTGFMQDETRAYDDALFILNINKTQAPYSAGLINFFSVPEMYCYTDALEVGTGDTTVQLEWSSFYTHRVGLQYSIGSLKPPPSPFSKTYDPSPVVIRDSTNVKIPGVKVGDVINFSMYAYDAANQVINSKPFPVTVELGRGVYNLRSAQSEVRFPKDKSGDLTLIVPIWGFYELRFSSDYPSFLGITFISNFKEFTEFRIGVGSFYGREAKTVTFTMRVYEPDTQRLLKTFECKVKFIPV